MGRITKPYGFGGGTDYGTKLMGRYGGYGDGAVYGMGNGNGSGGGIDIRGPATPYGYTPEFAFREVADPNSGRGAGYSAMECGDFGSDDCDL
jgi:hypothetical protein